MAIRWEDLGETAQAQLRRTHGLSEAGRSKRSAKPAGEASLEDVLVGQVAALRLPAPLRQHRFHDKRLWRFDLAWPARAFAVEVDGGTWVNGGHVRGKHYESDCEKGAEAALAGWRVIHVTTDMVDDGRAVSYIERFLMGA